MAYEYSRAKGQPGQIADASLSVIDSFAAEELIEFGRPLMRGTDPEKQAKNYVDDGSFTTKFLGISGYTATEIGGNVPIKDMVPVISQGRVFVALTSGLTIVAGNYAYLNKTTNVITNVSSAQQVIIGNFLSGGTSNGLTGTVFELELIPGFAL